MSDAVLDLLLSPFPPLRAGARLAGRLGLGGSLRFARQALLPVRRLGEEEFAGEGGRLLLAGNALHADLPPDGAGSGVFGWLLCCLGQQHGFPVPEGGAGRLIDALIARLRSRGGVVQCDAPVERVVIRRGRAVAVVTEGGQEIAARRAVLADVGLPALYLDLVGLEHLPAQVVDDVRRFQYDNATVKVDWALSGPAPWTAQPARQAGTVHLTESVDALTWGHTELLTGQVPSRPFLVVGQMTKADPTRSPAGTEVLWAYTHVPQRVRGDAAGDLKGVWDGGECEVFADRMQQVIERFAPGFGDVVLDRHVIAPPDLQAANANLVGGAINGGTAQPHQQFVFRPVPGLARAETPIARLYLASASAHPGGGVHGAPGANAARAAVAHHRASRIAGVAVAGIGVAARSARRSPRR